MDTRNTEGDREVSDILDKVFKANIPNVDSAIVGWLSVKHPELLQEALDTITRHAHEKKKGNKS